MSGGERSEREAALEAYNEVVESAELGDIRLVEMDFKVKPTYFEESERPKHRAKFNCNISNIAYDAESASLGGMIEWTVGIELGRKKLLSVKAVYIVIYDSVPNVDQIHIDAFFKKVGRFATYPYFRSAVSQLSWASRADLPTLPVLK